MVSTPAADQRGDTKVIPELERWRGRMLEFEDRAHKSIVSLTGEF
jgi:hypothetical protein